MAYSGISSSLFLIAVGAILAFAVHFSLTGVSINAIGLILMAIGLIGFALSVITLSDLGPYSDDADLHSDVTETRRIDLHRHHHI